MKAAISATERVKITETEDNGKTVEKYKLPVLDTDPSNNTAVIAVVSSGNVDPMFQITRSVLDKSPAGTPVGDPIPVKEPNSGDTLTFTLTGAGADKCTVSSVSGDAQVAVASGANLRYETEPSYDLTLGVSDGKDANDTVDHTIGVLIEVGPISQATLDVSNTSPNVGQSVKLSVTIQNPPVHASQLSFILVEMTNGSETDREGASGAFGSAYRSKSTAGTHTYYLRFWNPNGNESTETNRVTVTWSGS